MSRPVSVSEDAMKSRQSVLDVGQRNQLEAMQAEVRRNNEQLTTLRRENKELRSVLQQTLRGQRNISVEDHYAKEEELLHNKNCVLKRSLNAVKAKNSELMKEIEKAVEENTFLLQEGHGAMEEDSSVAHKIRALENRLDKCLVKHNEVNTIRRTYETLLERLQLEQAGFNTQVSSTEQALQCADKELAELVAVWKSAAKARDAAKAEVADLKSQIAAERQKQRKDLDERRAFIEAKRQQLETKHETLIQKLQQQEERHARAVQNASSNSASRRRGGHRSGASSASSLRPEEVEELQKQKVAYLRLRDMTMGVNVADVISKLCERTTQNEQLQTTSHTLEADVQGLEERKVQLQTEWESVNHRAGHALVSARVMRAARDAHARANGTADAAAKGEVTAGAGEDDDGADGFAGPGGAGDSTDFGFRADRRHDRRLILDEFRQHLAQRQDELEEAQETHDSLVQLLREVDMGVKYLAEKLSITNAAAITSSSTGASKQEKSATKTSLTIDLLRSCGAKLQLMLEELSQEELDAIVRSMSGAKFTIPETNLRVEEVLEAKQQQQLLRQMQNASASRGRGSMSHLGGAGGAAAAAAGGGSTSPSATAAAAGAAAGGGRSGSGTAAGVNGAGTGGDDYPENEIHDRQELKMMSIATVEREQQKARKRQMQQRRNKEEMV
ncbi:hypothetical protein ABB37_08836 [Leptomonas pyrrhocoris]|uniref:Axonemal dynein intermediate chain protein n=1 Tax=Leptomonas pyrrhocoris TaxID=157538 RepID=A0A0N0VDG0_LEPPY|nr:hypothetical protein ABB37_08836 [Leptomonas pyrrhocoris]KPA75174.1 hypothetical protein ABB37_08836 [Leptomonas pyrrhocoris]|eukprot:XP_015653613.1 hypothetical protein ABB37_08836 [Leptomonas pyrrhocoris]